MRYFFFKLTQLSWSEVKEAIVFLLKIMEGIEIVGKVKCNPLDMWLEAGYLSYV